MTPPREEAGCRQGGTVRAYPATIGPRNGFGTPIAARYVGTAYEGGYRHEYRSRELAITYFFVNCELLRVLRFSAAAAGWCQRP